MGIFDEVKKRVTAYDAVSYYGIKINNKGMCCCPFHDDKNPGLVKKSV